ncbi:type IX secretion system sortase PorU [Subsaxibacter sp. CAU 1640]|uniref:type IX secretion system sortase PorU n=1 Tax=Subsaxibacter sp. CAU 1640 TaxID=2933271 RepID=UPI002003523F|nr:type IX secretion system sortase PorU [Subsaxibacter sp. CAU 1640]MCK7591847.1 type IX secretion system sortase PorU [Subsaxibacter sp. CAU 1640]
MNKYLPFIFLAVCPSLLFSQQKSFDISWNGTKIFQTNISSFEVPAFDDEHLSFNTDYGLLYFTEWDSNVIINESSVELSDVSYSVISRSDLKGLPLNTIPGSPKLTITNAKARDKRSIHLQITPIIKDNGVFKKITSFTVKYNTFSAKTSDPQQRAGIVNSVLSTGQWYRFYVDKSGVFKISKDFLNDLGVNTNVDPRTIKVFGNGGAMLPFLNSSSYPNDLTENAIKFVGEEDGIFNNEDYILFYGEGPKGNVSNLNINTNLNPYTDKSYYYITVGPGYGKRIQPMAQPTGNPDVIFDTFHDYQFHEIDEYNIAKIGRRWFGDRFGIENQKEFLFNFPNLVTTEPVSLKVYVGATAEVQTSMEIKLNGNVVSNLTLNAFADTTLATGDSFTGQVSLSSPEATVMLTYNNNNNPASIAYLDYLSIEATRALRYDGKQFPFKHNSAALASGIVQYSLNNATAVSEIWDISNKYDVTNVVNTDHSAAFIFKAQGGVDKNYLVVAPSNYYLPLRDGNVRVSNQNLKGTIFNNAQGEFQDVDYIIVASSNYVNQAERLAQINRNRYGLNVKVVTLKEIYNEFSSGQQDVAAIRNFLRYVYLNASSETRRLKYLCLFGDASYDYKDRISNNTNIVPSWLSYNSFSLTNSYISDDFYGNMDESEGSMATSDKLDIAVGRILADSPQRAKELVDKIELYYKEPSYGSWRNTFVVISDDVDRSGEQQLQSTTDQMADLVSAEKPFLNIVKIHSDSYQQEATASGARYPKVNKAIKDAIEVGALVVNYFGHGGEDGLAHEFVFDKIDAQDIRNTCKFNCFVTVTCEFTKFDNPQRPTAGELIYWNSQGGSISLITTTREIFLTVGVGFNKVMEKYLFAFGSDNYPSMAEALRLTKNDPLISTQKEVVFYIGDPAMKLAFPKPNIRLTKINDVPLGQNTDVLKALSRVKLSGEVVDTSGNILSNYNGTLTATIYDKEIQRATLGNDGVRVNNQLVILNFKTLGEKIFIGQASVNNGLFDFEFVVPRDIGIPVGNGKASFYSKTDNPLQDQAGASFDIQIGGINENAEEDNIGPIINLFMNDENFVTGGITNESPTLLAKIQDSNGINTASGIGHDIVAIIDGDETNPFVLNDYYQADIDDYQNGKVSYAFRDLEPGLHTLTLKAWDVYNNSSTSEIQFVVHDKDQELIIDNVLNYPNPFINYTEFWFNHNSSEPLDVSIQIFTVSGKLVRTLNGQTGSGECCNQGASNLSRNIVWDGRDDFGDKIGKGVYIYKLKVRSNQLNKQVEKIEKLVIL